MLAALLALASFQSSPPLYLERTFDPTGLSAAHRLDSPTDAFAFPGDDRILVTQERGKVRIIQNGQLLQRPFVNAVPLMGGPNSVDLVGITFHPQFDVNGYVYLWCGAVDPIHFQYSMVLGRVTVDPLDPNRAAPGSWAQILRVPFESGIHFGGRIAFHADGMLWVGIGDGANYADGFCSSQDMTRLTGKMIRIDVDSAFPYAIPPDNPFVGVPGVAPEIVHSGLRHPWKWSFDEASGDLWIGDLGWATREEVNFAAAGQFGLNFGWPAEDGELCGDDSGCSPTTPACGDPSYTGSIFEYAHGPECAITGGHVYYGSAVPWLVGWYLCADLCTNQMWRIRKTPLGTFEVREQAVVAENPLSGGWSSLSFAKDGFGEMLFLEYLSHGMVYRLRGSCGATRTCEGAVNATGTDAKIRWVGATSLAENQASVFVTDLPAFSPALLFYGPLTDLVAMGNGHLCVGGPLSRVSVDVADSSGTSRFDLDLDAPPFRTAPGQVESGSTWTFQAWYRDIGGPLGATYNFSGATSVTFCQ